MELLHRRCAGLDVHKKTVVAAIRLVEDDKLTTEVRTFETTTAGLLALSDWLSHHGVTIAAMEATGVYWKPVWHVLSDGDIALVLANAAHVKNVPGRKTDVKDASWLAELAAHGLIRGSFVPDDGTQEMRALLRTRKQLVRERGRHAQRIHKTLEDAHIKIDAELSDVLGKSGRAMLDAMVAGETDPVRLAALAHRNVKCPQAKLAEALQGRVRDHHRFLLGIHLAQIDSLDGAIVRMDREVETNLAPFRTAAELLATIPGVATLTVQTIVSEIGTDMSRFPPPGICCRGPACVRAMTRAPASALFSGQGRAARPVSTPRFAAGCRPHRPSPTPSPPPEACRRCHSRHRISPRCRGAPARRRRESPPAQFPAWS
jgi:transposase